MIRCHPDPFDLRQAFTTDTAWSSETDEARPAPEPPAENDTTDDAAGDDEQEGEAGDQLTDDEIKNPRVKALSDEAAKHRNRAKQAEDQATTLTAEVAALTDQVRTLRLQVAFSAAAHSAGLTDTDAAWKLAAEDLTAVTVADDGNIDIERISAIVQHVAERYPYLATAPTPSARDAFPAEASGRPIGRKASAGSISQASLEARFPALRRGR